MLFITKCSNNIYKLTVMCVALMLTQSAYANQSGVEIVKLPTKSSTQYQYKQSASPQAAAQSYNIGVYYFGGWQNNIPGNNINYPWIPIQNYGISHPSDINAQRQPMLGWYNDGDPAVVGQQIAWMNTYGINYVVFDWYFTNSNTSFLDQSIQAYMQYQRTNYPQNNKVKFAILWANDYSQAPSSMSDWVTMVKYWVNNYFNKPEYMLIDNRPVVFIFLTSDFEYHISQFATTKELLDKAQSIAIAAGLQGINFVAGTPATLPMINSYARDSGYSEVSAYNYHQGPSSTSTVSHSYSELDQDYRSQWSQFASIGDLPVIVPMTAGWDKAPWGGSADPLHDNSYSTPAEFKTHLEAAKTFMDNNLNMTKRTGIICCWNEFGEGSIIEPTKQWGFSYLQQVHDVFGSTK